FSLLSIAISSTYGSDEAGRLLYVAELGQRLGERQAGLELLADPFLLAGEALALDEHFLDHFLRNDDCAVLVGEDEIARLHSHARARCTAQPDVHLPGIDLPAPDRLNGRAISGKDRKAVRFDPPQVAHASVDQRTDAAALLHADRDQLAEVADAFAVAAPHADVAGGQSGAGLHLLGVAALAVGRHLAPDRVGP